MEAMRVMRNIAAAVGLLWVAFSVTAPVNLAADYCHPPSYLERFDMAGACAPGGEDACGYFRSYCEYLCFTNHMGATCWGELVWCSEYQTGEESNPVWCISSGYCDCWYDF